jgi:hypothetical protein
MWATEAWERDAGWVQNMASQKSRREQYTSTVASYAAPRTSQRCAACFPYGLCLMQWASPCMDDDVCWPEAAAGSSALYRRAVPDRAGAASAPAPNDHVAISFDPDVLDSGAQQQQQAALTSEVRA